MKDPVTLCIMLSARKGIIPRPQMILLNFNKIPLMAAGSFSFFNLRTIIQRLP